ncbi:type II secretion system protein N [Marinobacter fonticola]|uniref:type II secretion system protein N n=1 Tax=Marinobacter fonticola TaxID=2603215 RepID=UPI0011E6F9F6|nr:type II secretion system protein N [Marinobacter fonticola]
MTDTPESPFLRPGKVVLLTLLGLVVYLVALVFWIPAGWVWHLSRDSVPLPPGVAVEQVSGQLWNGALQARVMGHSLQVGWHIDGLIDEDAYLPVGWRVQTSKSSLQGEVRLTGVNAMALSADGHINISEFSREIQRSGGAMIEGNVNVNSLSLAMTDGSLTQLNGRASWPGGQVTWPMGGSTQSAVLPAMQASVDERQGRIDLQISSADSPDPVISANLQPDGMAQIQVFRRMLDLVNQPWSGNAAPGDVVFSVRQRVMPAG